jgi:hypothetical protein
MISIRKVAEKHYVVIAVNDLFEGLTPRGRYKLLQSDLKGYTDAVLNIATYTTQEFRKARRTEDDVDLFFNLAA